MHVSEWSAIVHVSEWSAIVLVSEWSAIVHVSEWSAIVHVSRAAGVSLANILALAYTPTCVCERTHTQTHADAL